MALGPLVTKREQKKVTPHHPWVRTLLPSSQGSEPNISKSFKWSKTLRWGQSFEQTSKCNNHEENVGYIWQLENEM